MTSAEIMLVLSPLFFLWGVLFVGAVIVHSIDAVFPE